MYFILIDKSIYCTGGNFGEIFNLKIVTRQFKPDAYTLTMLSIQITNFFCQYQLTERCFAKFNVPRSMA